MPPTPTPDGTAMPEPILEFKDVHVHYHTDDGVVEAVRGVNYRFHPDEILAIVGESGCGKSQSSYAAMGLVQPPGRTPQGKILFREKEGANPIDLLSLGRNSKEMRAIRGGRLAMIFQEPMTALSPVHRIGTLIDEVLRLHTDLDAEARFKRACEMLTRVGIPDAAKRYKQYSFEFSGGMRQRIMIAIALACNPRLLIADEPTTGLDVTIQAQILDLIKQVQAEFHIGVVLITHDLAVVAETAHRVAVMYLGRIVEEANVLELFKQPRHPYTVALLQSVIGTQLSADGRLPTIQGTVPGPLERVPGCPFHPRCQKAIAGLCERELPRVRRINPTTHVACHLYNEFPEDQP